MRRHNPTAVFTYDANENFVFARTVNSIQQLSSQLFRPETIPAGNPRSRMKFMHIKFISDKNFFCCTHTEQHFATRSVLQKRFLSIFWQFFQHFLKRRPAVTSMQWPDILQSFGASIFISKECPTIILDARDNLKSFKS